MHTPDVDAPTGVVASGRGMVHGGRPSEETGDKYTDLAVHAGRVGADRVAQVRRMRIAARCLGITPVYVDDGAHLVAEMYDRRGQIVEVWTW